MAKKKRGARSAPKGRRRSSRRSAGIQLGPFIAGAAAGAALTVAADELDLPIPAGVVVGAAGLAVARKGSAMRRSLGYGVTAGAAAATAGPMVLPYARQAVAALPMPGGDS